jgi:hypothetical protein
MRLSSQDLPDIDDVTVDDVERIVGGGPFGQFVILEKGEDSFIQAGSKGRPADWAFEYDLGTEERQWAEEWKAFVERTGSERWALEYIDETTGHQYQATWDQTLEAVRQSFLQYLSGDDSWRERFTWILLECGCSSACGEPD